MLLMVEKGIRGGICHANNKYMKVFDENKELHLIYLMYCDVNNLYGWAMPRKLPLDGFTWVENTSQFTEDFIKN